MLGRRASRLAAGVVAASAVAVLLVSAAAQTRQHSLPPPLPPRGPITSAEAVEMVRAHNAWRVRAGVLPLRWAADLAAQAQNQALQLARHDCALEHGRLADDVGENLYRASALESEGGSRAFYAVSAHARRRCLGRRVRRLLPLHGFLRAGPPVRPLHPDRLAVDGRSRLRHGGLSVPRAGLGLPLPPARQCPRPEEIAKRGVGARCSPRWGTFWIYCASYGIV